MLISEFKPFYAIVNFFTFSTKTLYGLSVHRPSLGIIKTNFSNVFQLKNLWWLLSQMRTSVHGTPVSICAPIHMAATHVSVDLATIKLARVVI